MEPESRRSFILKTGTLLLGSAALTQFLEACQNPSGPNAPELPRIQGMLAGGTVTVTIASDSPLASPGNAALVQFGSGSALVFRSDPNSFLAVTSVCTHQQCTVSGFENQQYVCSCHGSRFSTSGQVKNGPAPSPLRMFATQFSNDELTIIL